MNAQLPDQSAPLSALVVDDEADVRYVHALVLRNLGFAVVEASTGQQALELLGTQRFDLMLCDMWMPGAKGDSVVASAIALDEDLAVIMISADSHALTATRTLGVGAVDYLVKPVEPVELRDAVNRALRSRVLRKERRRVEWLIRDEVEQRTRELAREREALRQLTVRIAETLSFAMEAKDVYLRGHSLRVSELAASIAEAMGLDEEAVEAVRLAARLHDVGKIGIREEVLNKPGPLTDDELRHVRDHVRLGMEILAPLQHLGDVLTFVHDHHERWDGTGYPRGLRGPGISLGGRILCAADAFDAMTSRRAFRQPIEPAAALEQLAARSAGHLDPDVFAVLRAVVEQHGALTFLDADH